MKKPVVVDYKGVGGIPKGAGIYYICLKCKDVVESSPIVPLRCMCGNISIDPDGGRAGARELDKFLVVKF
jgi:ribosomal protein S27E